MTQNGLAQGLLEGELIVDNFAGGALPSASGWALADLPTLRSTTTLKRLRCIGPTIRTLTTTARMFGK